MLKNKHFSPSIFATVLMVCTVLVMCRLGMWQFDRAQQKIALQAAYDEKLTAPPQALDAALIASLTENRYQTVSLEGTFVKDFQFILDNQPRGLISGYDVITPFVTRFGIVLVNRGWVERNIDRTVLPDTTISEQPRVIQGKINLPGKAFGLGAMTLENTWPRRLQFVEYSAINALLASEGVDDGVLPFVLMLDANEPDGLQRDWKPLPQGPEKHYAYMVQWFAMALTVCVIYFVLSMKTRENDGEVHDK